MSRFSRIPGFQQSQILDFPDFSKQMFLFAQEIICLFIQSFLELSKISLLPNSYYLYKISANFHIIYVGSITSIENIEIPKCTILKIEK